MPAKKVRLASDDLKVCNCAQCDVELLGRSMVPVLRKIAEDNWPPLAQRLEFVAGRIYGRPYCPRCLRVAEQSGHATATRDGEPSPWQENAVRYLEDGPA